ncbi:hypothetical protein [Nannocystis bainbridge]|uniref:Uncharacterized protein n=1 Tax=Nannocystis bainbridge TaxID=2995303 RepID=A0ABT5DUQ6_9BACT|nr:hypothetical protein [Nannocystis bainbridge]MDC0716162.1 hypothetical protein [Nannocystis bainbridge]
MSFVVRPFAACLAAFEALEPLKTRAKKHRPVTRQDAAHYASSGAWSRHDLSKFPKSGPQESLHQFADLEFSGITELDDGPRFVQWANFGNAVGTWNAVDDDGSWQCVPGAWIVALCELGRDDDDFGNTLDVAFACWRVEDGYAVMITPYGGAATRIPAVSGIPWPEAFKESRLWYGE